MNDNAKFIFSHDGDRDVGIPGEEVYVEYVGGFCDDEYKKDFVDAIRQALAPLFDGELKVIEEHEHPCEICGKNFKHLDDYCCDLTCGKECADRLSERQEEARREAEEVQRLRWEALSPEEKEAQLSGGFDDKDYFRDRNERTLARINGAGARC